MSLLKLNFRPGVNKENTPYTEEGGWVDSDKIRFRSGKPEKIGGWDKYIQSQLTGVPRSSQVWRSLDGTIYTAYGTHSKIFVESSSILFDVTPIRVTYESTDSDNCIETDGSTTTVIVNITSHGCTDGAYVTISGSTDVGGVPAAEINAEHEINYIDQDSFSITVTTSSTSSVAAGGGTSIEVACQINPGQIDGTYQYGFGAGVWGAEGWGTARTSAAVELYPRTWSLENWGEDLIINPIGGAVYIWDATTPEVRAVQITEAPHKVNHVLVTKDRHLVCFGCNQPGTANASTDLDSLQIRWSDQEDYADWTVRAENTAGDQLLTSGTEIRAAANTEAQVIVWTDDSVESMQYIGPPYTFGFQQVGSSVGIISPQAWVAYNNILYWMGDNAFYTYQGGATVMPCTVQKFVFSNLDIAQRKKVFTSIDRENYEISWYYPTEEVESTVLNGDITDSSTTIYVGTTAGFASTGCLSIGDENISYTGKTDVSFTGCTRAQRGSTAAAHSSGDTVYCAANLGSREPARYVSFSLIDNLWWIGRLERTTWADAGALRYPIATSPNGYIYNHESGYDADGEPMVAYIQSADFDIGEGDNMMFIHRVIPDFFVTGSVDMKMRSRYYPLSAQVNESIGTVTTGTTKLNTRIRGRQMALRIESDDLGDYWKYGAARIDQRPDGRR